jgi:hypothetical protein
VQKVYAVGVPLAPALFVGDMSPYEMALLSLKHFVNGLTVEKIRQGAIGFPEGKGEFYLLPALVEEPSPMAPWIVAPWIEPSRGQGQCPVCKGPFMYWPRRDEVELMELENGETVFRHKVCPEAPKHGPECDQGCPGV